MMHRSRYAQIVAFVALVVLVLPVLFGAIPGLASPQGAPQAMPPHPQKLREWQQQGRSLPPFLTDPAFFQRKGINQSAAHPSQLTGTINALAVVVDFSDNVSTVTASFFDSLIFAPPVSGLGSVRDYYAEVSYGQVDIVTVDLPSSLGWVRAPNNYSYYTNNQYCWGTYPNNCQKLAEDVVDAVNSVVDFSHYDNDGDGNMEPIMLIHAGPGAEFTGSTGDIWSHSWTLAYPRTYDGVTIADYVVMPEYWQTVTPAASDMTIGVFCHEMGHGFWHLPDLYDVDYSSNGVGYWSLMSFGSWNGPNSGGWGSDGSSPSWPDAWSRIVMGFDTYFMNLNPVQTLMIPVESLPGSVMKLKSTGLQVQEYFLLENRQQLSGGYDFWLPGNGLLIWHVDEGMWSFYGGPDNNLECLSMPTFPHCFGTCTGSHYLVALEQADGLDELEFAVDLGDAGDPFPGSTNNTAWQWYGHAPVNPESGSWYDVACSTDSCLDVLNILPSPPFDVMVTVQQASCSQTEADLGDAPDSFNSYGWPMTAYPAMGSLPHVQANYPTVYWGPPATPGPRHHFTFVDSWLGLATTGELQADQLPDQDMTRNISPTHVLPGIADQDSIMIPLGDDGLGPRIRLADCMQLTLPYTVTVASTSPITRYVNAWLDMNRDGDWDDTLTCPGGIPAPEWIVQDQVPALYPGLNRLVTPPFVADITVHQDLPFESWLRISIADMPAPVPYDGRGPAMGYDLGETEDYHLFLDPLLHKGATFTTPPAPGDQITFSMHTIGIGNVVALGAVISDVLPSGLEYVSSNPPGSYDPASRTVTWSVDVSPFGPKIIDLVVEVTAGSCETITNTSALLWAGTLWRRAPFIFQTGCEADDPTAAFTWLTPACVDRPVAFRNHSSGTGPLSYSWDLDGDGLPDSTQADPTWQYSLTGTYTVTLTTTNACSCTDTYSDTVEVQANCIFRVYLPIIVRNMP